MRCSEPGMASRFAIVASRESAVAQLFSLGSMSLTPTIRVILSDVLIVAGLVAIVFGYGPFPMLFAFAGYFYIRSCLKPKIPDFSRRGRPLVRWAWNSVVVSVVVVYFFFEHLYAARIYSCIAGGAVLVWMICDDIYCAKQMERSDDAA